MFPAVLKSSAKYLIQVLNNLQCFSVFHFQFLSEFVKYYFLRNMVWGDQFFYFPKLKLQFLVLKELSVCCRL